MTMKVFMRGQATGLDPGAPFNHRMGGEVDEFAARHCGAAEDSEGGNPIMDGP